MFYIPRMLKFWDGLWMERCVKRWLSEFRALNPRSILDAHFGFPEGVGCYLAARKLGLPCFITLRGVEIDWFRVPRVKQQMLQALRNVSGVIAVSHSLRDEAVAQGVPESQITVIANGCDERVFKPGSQAAAREKLGISRDLILLVCVANLKQVKGHDLLFKALAKLPQDRPWQLHCVGAAENQATLAKFQNLAHDAGLQGRVNYVGELPPEQVADHLRACDLFVLASHREGCCNAILEALSCKCRIVCTDVGDNRRLLSGYSGCRLVPPNDAEAMSAAIDRMIKMEVDDSVGATIAPVSWSSVAERTMHFFQERTNIQFSVARNDA